MSVYVTVSRRSIQSINLCSLCVCVCVCVCVCESVCVDFSLSKRNISLLFSSFTLSIYLNLPLRMTWETGCDCFSKTLKIITALFLNALLAADMIY